MAMDKEMAAHMAENDLRTMIDAEKIKKDKPRYVAAMKKHKELMEAMAAMHDGDKGYMKGMK